MSNWKLHTSKFSSKVNTCNSFAQGFGSVYRGSTCSGTQEQFWPHALSAATNDSDRYQWELNQGLLGASSLTALPLSCDCSFEKLHASIAVIQITTFTPSISVITTLQLHNSQMFWFSEWVIPCFIGGSKQRLLNDACVPCLWWSSAIFCITLWLQTGFINLLTVSSFWLVDLTTVLTHRVVTVPRFHFRFGFGSVLHRKPRFRFFPVSVLREIWVKQTINCKRNNFIREPRQLRRI